MKVTLLQHRQPLFEDTAWLLCMRDEGSSGQFAFTNVKPPRGADVGCVATGRAALQRWPCIKDDT